MRQSGAMSASRGRSAGANTVSIRMPASPAASPREPAHQRQEQALDDRLPEHARTAGAERDASGVLGAPLEASRQHQVRDVDGRHEQHEANAAEQQQQRRTDPPYRLLASRR